MSYDGVNKLIESDEKLHKFMIGTEGSVLRLPVLITETLEMLADDSPLRSVITDANKVALCTMCRSVHTKLASITMFDDDKKIKTLCGYSKKDIYYIEALNGNRIATKREVEDGVEGLYAKPTYVAGEKAADMLHVIMWIISGDAIYLYRNGDTNIQFGEDGKVSTPVYTLIYRYAEKITQATEYYDSDEYKKAVKIIQKFQKTASKLYKDIESDEVTAPISKEQLVKDILDRFPRGSSNINYRKAVSLALAYERNTRWVTPAGIAFMREQHRLYGETLGDYESTDSTSDRIEEMCNELERLRYSKMIDPNHFVYKIIATIKKKRYKNVSSKQKDIIIEAYNKVKGKDENDDATSIDEIDKTENEEDQGYGGISNILEL